VHVSTCNNKMLVVSLTFVVYNYPIANQAAWCIIVITLYYYIRSFKCAIILLYVKCRFRIVCQSQWHIALRCFYDPGLLGRVHNSR